jgi:hypothetical protein
LENKNTKPDNPHIPYSVSKGHPQTDELCRGWMIISLPP